MATTAEGAAAAPAEEAPSPFALLGLAAVVGLAAGGGVIAFLAVEHRLHHLLWEAAPEFFGWSEPAAWWIYAVLMLGAVGVWLALKLPGHGGHHPLDGLGFDVGPRQIVSVLLAALISLSVGAVIGPEAPLMAVGSAIAAVLAARLPPPQRQVLMLAGAVSAITLILGNPLVAGILVLEVLVMKGSPGGKQALMTVLPVLLAMGTGYVIQVGVGFWGGVGESRLALPGLPTYGEVLGIDMLAAFPVAVAASLVAVAALWGGGAVQRASGLRPLPTIVGAGFVVATAAVAVNAITGESVDTVLFSGQSATAYVVTVSSVSTLVLIAIAKTVAYAVSVGSGFRGGLIFPAIYLGVVMATIMSLLLPASNVSALAAAGIAAGVASLMRLPFTAVVLAVLLCSGAGLAITTPAILGSVVGILVRSAYDARLAAQQAAAER